MDFCSVDIQTSYLLENGLELPASEMHPLRKTDTFIRSCLEVYNVVPPVLHISLSEHPLAIFIFLGTIHSPSSLPRVFLPLFRTKPSAPSHNFDDQFRRPPVAMSRDENGNNIHHISGSPPHMLGAHPSMRMHHPGANDRQQASSDHSSSRSIISLALPMYTVGIGAFFIYTCCKYWSKTSDEKKSKNLSFNADLPWMNDKRKVKYDILDKDSEEEDESKESFYAGLDPDYVEYLKAKKQKALDAERAMTAEQKQMHFALEEMKKSLSFISAKLVTKESRGNLNGDEIVQLQDRLTSTEAQMCKILAALDSASDQVHKITKKTAKSSKAKDEQEVVSQSSSGEEEEEEDNASLSDEENLPDPVDNENDNRSESLSSDNLSDEGDQSIPIDEQNLLIRRKH